MSEGGVSVEPLPIEPLGRGVLTGTGSCEDGPTARFSADGDHAPMVREEGQRGAEVDLRHLKRVARGLPEGDPVRQLIEGEPDSLPLPVLAAKADSWVLLLLRRGD